MIGTLVEYLVTLICIGVMISLLNLLGLNLKYFDTVACVALIYSIGLRRK